MANIANQIVTLVGTDREKIDMSAIGTHFTIKPLNAVSLAFSNGTVPAANVVSLSPINTYTYVNDGRVDFYIKGSIGQQIEIYNNVDNVGTVGGTGVLNTYEVTDPAVDAAVTTAIIDSYGGSIITLTGAGNTQTMQSPTDTTPGKIFLVANADTSTHNVTVVAGLTTYTLEPGEGMWFIRDGTSWIGASGMYVDLTTNQTVAGVKTFTSFPITPSAAPTTDYQVANKKYTNDQDTIVLNSAKSFAVAMAAAL